MAKKLYSSAGVALALAGALALTGCVSDAGADTQTQGKATTKWRDTTSQQEVDPTKSNQVSDADMSRQDGPKEIKFRSVRVEEIDSVTNKRKTSDKESLFKVEVLSVTPVATDVTVQARTLILDSKAGTREDQASLSNMDTYKIDATIEYVSGFDAPISSSVRTLFWPVTHSGSVGSLAVGSDLIQVLSPRVTSFTLIAAVPTGSPAPDGIRYGQRTERNNKLLSPQADIFPLGDVVFQPKADGDTDADASGEKE